MNKRNIVVISMLAIVAVLAAGVVMAHPEGRRGQGPGMMAGGGPGAGAGPFGRLAKLKEELGLTDQQVAEIKGIFESLRAQNEPLREQLRDGRGEGIETLIANPSDTARAQARLDEQLGTQRALRMNMIAATSKALKVLNAGQRAKLGTLLEERQERRAKRLKHRGRR